MRIPLLAAAAVALGLAAVAPAGATTVAYGAHIAPTANAPVIGVTYGHYRIPVERIVRMLEYKGFWDFKRVRWYDDTYVITARGGDRGRLFKITVDAYRGHILDVERVHVRRHHHWQHSPY